MDVNIEGKKDLMSIEEDIYTPIPKSKRVYWASMLMTFVGMWVSLYSVAIGYSIGMQLSTSKAIWSCIIGYALAGIIAAFVAEIGRQKGLPSYVLAKGPLQWYGQMLIALIMFTVIGFGSIGLQADAVGRAICENFPELTPYRALVSGLICSVMMISAVIGIKLITKVSWITMPFFFVVTLIACAIAINSYGGLSKALEIKITEMSFSRAIFLNAGAWAGFVMLMADVSRFLQSRRATFTIVPIAFLIGAIPPICGVLLGATVKQPLEALFPVLGIGLLGLIAIIGAAWTTNDNNAYTAGLAFATAIYPWTKITRSRATIIVAILGILGAITGIGRLGVFEWIAAFHGSFNMSFVGVLIAHYYIVAGKKEVQTTGLSGIIAWITVGLLCHLGFLPFPFISAMLFAFGLYLAIYYGIEKKIYGEHEVDKIEPTIFRTEQT